MDSEHYYHKEQGTTYEILVQGSISQRWLDWFGDMTIRSVEGASRMACTTLQIAVPDQSALLGRLQKLHNLGHILLKIRRLE